MFGLVVLAIGLGYWNLRKRSAKRATKTDAIPLDDIKP
jgi:hypothetical protein